jgi:putative ABC transport system ATP-binding protein
MGPAIILADEPTGNLDSRSGEGIMLLFQELNTEGMTVLLVTHDATVARHGTRTIQMRDGSIIADRPIHDRLDARQVLAAMPPPVEDADESGAGEVT